MDQDVSGGADAFVALLRSQGSYQDLVKAGLTDDDIGVPAFATAVAAAFAAAGSAALSFSYRTRLGVTPRSTQGYGRRPCAMASRPLR